MKKIVLVLFYALIAIASYSQNDSSYTELRKDTLFTRSGFKIYSGQMLKIGTGTMPDGAFKYIRIASTSLLQGMGDRTYHTRINPANSLPAANHGFKYKVVRIDKYGHKKHGYRYYPIINVGVARFQIDVDNAISSGELDIPEEYKTKAKPVVVEVKQGSSLADELAKLKKLYDDSVLTKDEYESAKKKLLEKQQ